MANKKNYTPEELTAMANMYNSGTGLQAVADHYGISLPTVRKYIASTGTPIRGRGRPVKNVEVKGSNSSDEVVAPTTELTEEAVDTESPVDNTTQPIMSW
jgi:hypothetical protein